ncbi:MAG TPA: DUF4388 domain-containing protein [Polyangiaceae bacterium]|nr:DUF4388 domain-containing protein [Polyangiaceae bacterium]
MREPKAELVRVDSRGEAHPIGSVASQRMRQRAGTYRVLPAPKHVVFMRFTGEDGQRDAADGAIVRLSGEVTAPGALCDVLALLAQTGWRGELVVEDGESRRIVFFDQGSVVGACTNVEAERIGSVLYRYGALDDQALARVLEACKDGKRFGEAALEVGAISRDSLYKHIQKQIEEVVFATLMVGDGTFFFLDGFDETRLVSHHALSANALLMDAVTRMDEVKYFHEKVPSSDHVPVRSPNRGQPPEEFTKVYAAIDDRMSVEELGRATGLGEFETTKQVYGLVQSRHVVIHPPRLTGGPTALVATANSALLEVFRAAETGGLATELRESLASFAVGAGVYDILFRGAGPSEAGALDPERVAENAVIVAGGAHPDQVLKQMLHEYVSFALFSAGAALGSGAEAALTRSVAPMLAALHPQG